MTLKQKLLQAFIEYPEVWKIGPFKATSGSWVPVAPNFRNFFSHPELLKLLGKILANEIKKSKHIELLAGLETCGIPLVTITSLFSGIPMVYVRQKGKGTFSGKYIEGFYRKGVKAVLIDDALSFGGQKIQALKKVKGELTIKYILVIWDPDYPSKFRKLLKNKEVKIKSIVGKIEVMDYLKRNHKMHSDTYQVMMAQTLNPWDWHKDKKMWRLALQVRKRGTI